MDSITITDLEVRTRIGITADERKVDQRVLVSITLDTDTRSVAKADDVTKGIDYAVAAEIIRSASKTERKTIERMAEDIAEMLLERFSASYVTVTLKKFPFPDMAHVSVTIERP